MKLLFHIILAIFILSCNSSNVEFTRISKRFPFLFHFGQNVDVVPGADHSAYDLIYDLKVDRYENVISVGWTTDAMLEPSPAANNSALVIKMDKNGNTLWARQLGTATAAAFPHLNMDVSAQDQCWSVAVDRDENIYCGGMVSGAPALEGAPGGGNDAFMMKLSPEGNILWINQFGGLGNENCYSINVSPAGKVYCVTTSESKAYIVELNPITGDIIDSIYYPVANTFGFDLIIDKRGNVYMLGQTAVDLGLGEALNGTSDPFIWKLDTHLNPLKTKQYGTSYDWSGDEFVRKIKFNSQGDIYFSGGTNATSPTDSNVSLSTDIFFGKIESSTLEPDWTRQIALSDVTADFGSGFDNSTNEFCFDLTVDQHDNIICGGYTDGNLVDTNSFNKDIFIIKFSPSGQTLKGVQFGENAELLTGASYSGEESCRAVEVDSNDNVYCTGGTSSDFKDNSIDSSDIFIFRLPPSFDVRALY